MGFAVTRSESMLPFVQPTLAVCGSVTEIPTNVSGLLIGCPFFVLFFFVNYTLPQTLVYHKEELSCLQFVSCR